MFDRFVESKFFIPFVILICVLFIVTLVYLKESPRGTSLDILCWQDAHVVHEGHYTRENWYSSWKNEQGEPKKNTILGGGDYMCITTFQK